MRDASETYNLKICNLAPSEPGPPRYHTHLDARHSVGHSLGE